MARGWGGTSLDDRRAGRRERLLEVGLDLLGTEGSAALTVRSVCRRAELTDRYFYENFPDRDGLLLAVYDRVADEAGTVLADAVAAGGDARAVTARAVTAFVELLTDDPRKGRILLLEPMTDATLSRHSVALMPMFADLLRATMRSSATSAHLNATALIGGLANLFIRWLDGSLPVGRQELIEYCVELVIAVAKL